MNKLVMHLHRRSFYYYYYYFFFLFFLTLSFVRLAAYDLGNYRPATNDEVELMSVGFTLATQGVMGSDLFAGFAGVDQHYLFTLPVQHVLEAFSFRLFGVGLAQARWVSLLAGASTVWLVGWLAYRWFGLGTAVVGELLLVAWPSRVTLAPDGLPLWDVSRVARYDVLALAFAWLAIALLDETLRHPSRAKGFGLGLCCGVAALTTFTGAFALPLIGVTWLWVRGRRLLANRTVYWSIAGAGVVLVAWTAYCLAYRADLTAQLAVYGQRWNVLQPSFYLANALAEPSRYRDLLAQPSWSTWLLAIGIWPALASSAWRSRSPHATGDRFVVASLVTFGALLSLVDQTKTPLYAIILVPSVCLALGGLATRTFEQAWSPQGPRTWPLRITSSAVALAVVLGVGSDGVQAYRQSLFQAAQASQYLGLGLQIDAGLPPGGRILGPERWWWALHDHPYLSLRSLWFAWTAAASSGTPHRFTDLVTASQAGSIVVNDNVRGDIGDFPAPLQQQFWDFLAACTTDVLDLDDPTYLQIEVHAITRPPPDACT